MKYHKDNEYMCKIREIYYFLLSKIQFIYHTPNEFFYQSRILNFIQFLGGKRIELIGMIGYRAFPRV